MNGLSNELVEQIKKEKIFFVGFQQCEKNIKDGIVVMESWL